MKNARSLAAVIVLFAGLILACGGGKPVPAKYQGNWKGNDGTTIYMDADGRSGFKRGAKKVDGGAAEIDESAKTLTTKEERYFPEIESQLNDLKKRIETSKASDLTRFKKEISEVLEQQIAFHYALSEGEAAVSFARQSSY